MRYFRSPESYEHGSRSRYRLGCRCEPCAEANRGYERRRALERAKGHANPLIDASEVRARLQQFDAKGVTPRAVARLADVRWVLLYRIFHGEQGAIRKRAADAVLAVQPTAYDAHKLVPSYHSRQLLDGLYAEQFTPEDIAKRLRLKSPRVRVQPKSITQKNALRLRGLYRLLMGED